MRKKYAFFFPTFTVVWLGTLFFTWSAGFFEASALVLGVFGAPRCVFFLFLMLSPSCSSELREMINYHSALELIRGLISQLIALLSTMLSRARQSDGRRRLVDV